MNHLVKGQAEAWRGPHRPAEGAHRAGAPHVIYIYIYVVYVCMYISLSLYIYISLVSWSRRSCAHSRNRFRERGEIQVASLFLKAPIANNIFPRPGALRPGCRLHVRVPLHSDQDAHDHREHEVQVQHIHGGSLPKHTTTRGVPSFFRPGSRTTSEVVVRRALGLYFQQQLLEIQRQSQRETTSEETSFFFSRQRNRGQGRALGSRRRTRSSSARTWTGTS